MINNNNFIRLKDITHKITKGSTPSTLGFSLKDSGPIKFFKIENIKNKKLFTDSFIDDDCHFVMKRSALKENDILFTIAGTIGDTVIVNNYDLPANINQAIAIIRLKNGYNFGYVRYYLESISLRIKKESFGGVIKNFNLEMLKNTKIIKASVDTQKKITIFLDKNCLEIEEEISLLQKKSILLDEYKNALIYETVTKGIDKNAEMRDSGVEWIGEIPKHWSVNRLKDKLNIQKGAVFTDDLIKDDGVYPYINGGIKPSGLTNSFNCRENTIAVSEGGASSGYSQFMETKFWAGTHCYKINPKRNENSKYYYYLLKGFEKQIQAAKTGSAMPNLQKSKFINLVFSFTSNLKEQNEIVKYLDNETKKIEKQIGLINKKVELLKEYKQSLIYEAVTGQLEIE